MNHWVLVEHHGSAAERIVVEELGVIELTSEEVVELNKRIVHTDCRFYPAHWFKEIAHALK